jgi:hypothetical protein
MAAPVRLRARSSIILTKKNKSGNRRGSFEVDVGVPTHTAERLGENPGRDCGDYAVDIGDAGTEADQCEHVRTAIDQRGPEALKEWQAAPENDWRSQRELDPGQSSVGEFSRKEHAAHGKDEEWRSQDCSHPEPPRHIAEFRILFLRCGDCARFKRHAADRTRSGLGAHNFRVHGAGVFRARDGERMFRLQTHAA